MTEFQTRWLRLTPQTPLLLGDESSTGNYQETTDFIPGAALRGAVAGSLLNQCTQPAYLHDHESCPDKASCPFWQLFGAAEPRFGYAYPGSAGPVFPLPLTARSCKRFPGFPKQGDDKRHGVVDVLFQEFANGLVSDPHYPARPQLLPALGTRWSEAWCITHNAPMGKCPVCSEDLKPLTGYYAWSKNGIREAQPPAVARTTHVGINRARAVAEDELLFTQETMMPAGSRDNFFAPVQYQAGHQPLLEQALIKQHLYLGRGRSRGYGHVIVTAEAVDPYPGLVARLDEFRSSTHQALQLFQKQETAALTPLPGQLFTLTLRSPALLSQAGHPLRVPTTEYLGLPDGVVFLQAWTRLETIGGWDNAARLPRRTQQAVKAGSVYLYFAPDALSQAELLAHLERLETEGIGSERERGYGAVAICDPFHTQVNS